MPGTHDLWLFVLSGLLLNVTPGPDTLYIVARSTAQGLRGGAMAAMGIGAGTLVHILGAALGLSALLAASATAFTVVKVAGAIYLLYVGISLLRSTVRPQSAVHIEPASLRTVFMQGFLTNVLNPKVALFFLALLPQFVDADAPSKPLAFLFLGVIFNVNGTLWNLLVAWSAARVTRGLANSSVTLWLNRSIGALLVCLAARLALSRQ
jgi:threonine/homoserine/homoserine lactone efflux protein